MLDALTFLTEDIGLAGGLLIAAILALIFGGGSRRRMLGLLLLVAAMPISARLAALPLDASSLDIGSASTETPGDAIAVYGAGVFADKLGGMWPSPESIRRTAVGLALSQKLERPLVVSGGVVRPDLAAEAVVLANVMRLPQETILEAKARTTAENARYVDDIARREGWQSIILVTDRIHTRRALAASLSAGLSVAAVIDATREKELTAGYLLPGVSGLGAWGPVMHEYVGLAWYLVTGRIQLGTLFP